MRYSATIPVVISNNELHSDFKKRQREKRMDFKSIKKKYSKKSYVHFGFAAVDFANIINLAQNTDQNAVVGINAGTICPNDVDIKKCNEFFLSTTRDGDFVDVYAQKQVNDNALLPALLALQEMNPETLSIMVSADVDVNDSYWEIIVMYYEDVATVFYDRSIRRKEAVRFFGGCFQ